MTTYVSDEEILEEELKSARLEADNLPLEVGELLLKIYTLEQNARNSTKAISTHE